MKRAIAAAIALLIILIPASAFAVSPSPSATSKLSPTPSKSQDSGIIKLNSSGLEVMRLQYRMRDLGYLCFSATGNFASMSREGIISFQEQNNLQVDGSAGPEVLSLIYTNTVRRAPVKKGAVLNGPALKVPRKIGTPLNWQEANKQIPVGTTVKVTDYNTGTSFNLRRTGGEGYAAMETVSAQDTTNLFKAFAKYSFEKRAVRVTIGGTEYAASLSGYPYGTDTIGNNNIDGHIDLYFRGSTGILGLEDADHLRMIKIAEGN